MPEREQPNAVYELLYGVLSPLLGKLTGRKAIELACEQCGLLLARLKPGDYEALRERLRPMMRTLIGQGPTERVLDAIAARLEEGRVD
ncbi:MAG: hypothetical protein JXR96_00920 [Deltaproteobacteria bacterium]|nr:hypothetical protein [Deltaproteobacteria bacterium]